MSFRDRCVHCAHAYELVPCCFCGQYIRIGGGVTLTSDKPIIVEAEENNG